MKKKRLATFWMAFSFCLILVSCGQKQEVPKESREETRQTESKKESDPIDTHLPEALSFEESSKDYQVTLQENALDVTIGPNIKINETTNQSLTKITENDGKYMSGPLTCSFFQGGFVQDFSGVHGSLHINIEIYFDQKPCVTKKLGDGSLLLVSSQGICACILGPKGVGLDGSKQEGKVEVDKEGLCITYEGIKEARFVLLFGNLFSEIRWIEREGVKSLSIQPSDDFRILSKNPDEAIKEFAWSQIYQTASQDPDWDNEESLRNQFFCHWYFAGNKEVFNIEPSREVVSVGELLLNGCNP